MTAERHDVAAPSGTPRRARPAAAVHGEGGSALVIALIMIAVVAVVLLALLSYTGTSIRASASVRASRQTMYAADGAVEAAIQHVRNNPEIGYSVDENGDPVPSCDFDLPAQGAQPAVHVECEGQTASMRLGEGSVAADQPLYSILTLGRRANQQPNLNDESYFWSPNSWFDFGGKGEVGLYYNPALGLFGFGGSPAATAYLKGGVFSNSTIVASKGSLKIADEPDGSPGGSFKVRQSCGIPDGGQIIVEPSGTNPNCQVIGYPASGGGYGTDGQGVDPNYPSRIDLQGLPPLRSVPVCDPAKELVKFEPGWYNDAKALSELMRDCDGIDHDGDGKDDGADFWFRPGLYYFDFRNTNSVSCTDGARPHQWCIGRGKANPRVVGGTPVALDGGTWDPDPDIRTATVDLTPASSQSNTGWANGDNAKAIDGSEASATQTCWQFLWWWICDGSANITTSGYPQIPSTAYDISVTLRVNHHESSANGTRSVTIYPGGGGSCSFTPPYRASATTDSFTVPASCLGTATKINGMKIRYDANRNNQNGTAYTSYLDGFEVEVTYTNAEPDRFRFPQGCDDTEPGVQFVFGGDSGVRIEDGTLNLCAGPPAGQAGQAGFTRQRIAVYGIRPLPALKASSVSANGSPNLTDVDNAKVLFENPTNQRASLSYSGTCILFGPCPSPTVQSDPLTLTFPGLATQGQPGGYPAFPASTRVKKVELRANYSTVDNWTDLFGDPSPLFRVKTPEPGGGMRNCGDNTSLPPTFNLFDPNTWGGYTQAFADVTNCFRTNPADVNSPVDPDRLKNFTVDWVARDECTIFACSYTDELDGIELYITLEPTSSGANTWLPGSGCIVGLPNYSGGGGSARYAGDVTPTNCAVMKWNSGGPNFASDDASVMTSIIGTFYAPGGVLDMAEYGPWCTQTRKRWILFWQVTTCGDGWINGWDGLSYPVVDRGIIVRHLTIRGLKLKPGYNDPIIGCGPGTCGGTLRSPRLVQLQADVAGKNRVDAWVCYGPVESTGPPAPDRLAIGTTGKYCTGDGTGPPEIVRWNAT